MSPMNRQTRMSLAHPVYGSLGVASAVYYRPKNVLLHFISVVLSLKYTFLMLLFYLLLISKISVSTSTLTLK